MKNIKTIMKERKISIYKMSQELNVPYSTISDIVNEKTDIANVRFELGLLISDYLSVNPYEMVKRENIHFTDQFQNQYTGTLTKENGYYFVSFKDFTKQQQKIKIGKIANHITPFINEFAQWTMENYITDQILERWKEYI